MLRRLGYWHWVLVCVGFSMWGGDPVMGGDESIQAYMRSPRFPTDVLVVGILPVTSNSQINSKFVDSARDSVRQLLPMEIQRIGTFLPRTISGEETEMLTGRLRWRAEDHLPAGVLEKLGEHVRVQAVLFSEITQYQPFRGGSIGFRFHLVEVRSGETIWQVDHLFEGLLREERKSKRRAWNLDRVLGLPDGQPIEIEPVVPGGERMVTVALQRILKTLPVR